MGPRKSVENYLAKMPVEVIQIKEGSTSFFWLHHSGRPECQEIVQWLRDQGLAPGITEFSKDESFEQASMDFSDTSIAALFKLRFG